MEKQVQDNQKAIKDSLSDLYQNNKSFSWTTSTVIFYIVIPILILVITHSLMTIPVLAFYALIIFLYIRVNAYIAIGVLALFISIYGTSDLIAGVFTFLAIMLFYWMFHSQNRKVRHFDNEKIIKRSEVPKKTTFLIFLLIFLSLSATIVLGVFYYFFGAAFLLGPFLLFFIIKLFVSIIRKKNRDKNIYSQDIIRLYIITILLPALFGPFFIISRIILLVATNHNIDLVKNLYIIAQFILPAIALYISIKTFKKVDEYTSVYRTAMLFSLSVSILYLLFVAGYMMSLY